MAQMVVPEPLLLPLYTVLSIGMECIDRGVPRAGPAIWKETKT